MAYRLFCRRIQVVDAAASAAVPVTPDDHSERVPPDPMPNSAVKPLSADGSVGSPHVRVGHRQAFITPSEVRTSLRAFPMDPFVGNKREPL